MLRISTALSASELRLIRHALMLETISVGRDHKIRDEVRDKRLAALADLRKKINEQKRALDALEQADAAGPGEEDGAEDPEEARSEGSP